jgi:hypothetical protein
MVASKENEAFEQLLVEAIDDAFCSLGESIKSSIYFHLESRFHIKRQEIPSKIEGFSDALEHVFGLGARHLEILFMKNLHAKINASCKAVEIEWNASEMTFKDYVLLMEQSFEKMQLKEEKVEVFVCNGEKPEIV